MIPYSNSRKFSQGSIFPDGPSSPSRGFQFFEDVQTHVHLYMYYTIELISWPDWQSSMKTVKIGPLENFPLYHDTYPAVSLLIVNDHNCSKQDNKL